jgi:hypothetical protein
MKTILALLAFELLGIGANAHAQIVTSNHGVYAVQNTLSPAVVVKLVSRLHVGMKEEEAAAFLWTNKLGSTFSIGAITGWDAVYTLSNGCSLHLDYSARSIRPDGHWGGNGNLQRAFIQSNGVNIVSIPLRGIPEQDGATNRSQPSRSGTNRLPAAAGSGR